MRTIKNKCIFPSKSLIYFPIKKSQKKLRSQITTFTFVVK